MTESPAVSEPTPADTVFAGSIVALGASAGGLDALDRFFSSLPPLSQAAFIVIQHLAPEHKTMMDRLLARHTVMPVEVATHDMPLAGGHVYVIPPGSTMTLAGGHLRLAPRPSSGVTLPIDDFFDSLAREAASRAVGIVLSGTGSDGSRGVQSLDEAGAWVLAQDPDTARFDGMPRSAIATGCVDQVLPPEALATQVASLVTSGETRPPRSSGAPLLPESTALEPALRLLASVMRLDFSQYKPSTLLRRLERRLHATGCAQLQAYSDRLATHPEEVDLLRRELLIPVTRFFRDPEAFAALRTQVLEPLVEARRQQGPLAEPIRVWICATSTGEEAYSVAMLLMDVLKQQRCDLPCKIFATDVEPGYLERAASGRYDDADLADVPQALRERWFVPVGEHWQVHGELRQRLVFARHDLLSDAPFTQMDLVTCRNMLIYLRPAAQDRAVRRLTYALRPGGVLFLGSSESPTAVAPDLAVLDSRLKLYRLLRRPAALPPDDLLNGRRGGERLPARSFGADRAVGQRPTDVALQALATRYAPPALLVNADRELLHVFGDARRFLSIGPGNATLDVLQLLPPEIAPVAATLLHSATRDRSPQRSRAVPVRLSVADDPKRTEVLQVHVMVWPLDEQADRSTMQLMLALEAATGEREVAPGPEPLGDEAISQRATRQIVELERELDATRSNLQDTIQDLGTANEELQATNEEMMASNEELQSTNEELQSVNEELHTVNAEYQAKILELNDANADLESLTRATRIPLVFVAQDLRLTRFTPEAMALFRFREADLGRPLDDFSHGLDYPDLHADLRRALASGLPSQREATGDDGRVWLVTIQPYVDRAAERAAWRGGGQPEERQRAVVSCVDVSSLHGAQRLQAVLDALPEHVAVLDRNGIITAVNRAWREFAERNGDVGLRYSGPGINYLDICRQGAPGDNQSREVLQGLTAVLDGQRPAFVMQYPCHSPDEERWFLMHATPLPDAGGGCVVTHLNITGWTDPELVSRTLGATWP